MTIEIGINNIRTRHIMFTKLFGDMPYDEWESKEDFLVKGPIATALDLEVFPDDVKTVHVDGGYIPRVTCNIELDSLASLRLVHTGCAEVNLINLMGLEELRITGDKPLVLGSISTPFLTVILNGTTIHKPDCSMLEILKQWLFGSISIHV